MNNDEVVEGRPRPLSTGLWTLFSWLRRDDRYDSSDSLSSAGSDRTVASFAFLAPAHYQTAREPLILPPPGPPTDSYKKRVHDRNIRRHCDLDLTLHRKYGLLKGEGTSYDAFSLPPVRRINLESGNRWDRERRATSECYQRRLAHVPGKRRAPLPPVPFAGPTASLNRRNTRKRPAPQPPGRALEKKQDIIKNVEVHPINLTTQMNSNAYQDNSKLTNNDVRMGCKSEKYSKKDVNAKNIKTKSDKSFLKQIFDSKKRNSIINTTAVKKLPSISELDKQAAELIETCKLKALEENNNVTFKNIDSNQSSNESWFCIRCLRKYNSSVVTCVYCDSKQKVQSTAGTMKDDRGVGSTTSSIYTQTGKDLPNLSPTARNNDTEDKKKLKEMLKEMKDSLPKRSKHDLNSKSETKNDVEPNNLKKIFYSTETPTLRVGFTAQDDKEIHSVLHPSTSDITSKCKFQQISSTHKPFQSSAQSALVVQVVSAYKKSLDNNIKPVTDNKRIENGSGIDSKVKETSKLPNDKRALNTPLKISSLLNPMYIPRNQVLNEVKIVQSELKNEVLKSELKTEIPKSGISNFSPDKVKNNIVTEITSIPTSSTSKLTGPSGQADKKHKINLVKCSGDIQMSAKKELPVNKNETNNVIESDQPKENIITKPSPSKNITKNIATHDLHSRRRELINQLEKSIAKGDEKAAAEAAAKLAQLRLSCSVLSFSSQILSQPSTSSATENMEKNNTEANIVMSSTNNQSHQDIQKSPQSVPSSSIKELSPNVSKVTANPILGSNKVKPSLFKCGTTIVKPLHKNNNANVQRNVLEVDKETDTKNDITIAVMVEDREATRGPVNLRINRRAKVRDLRREAEASLGLATNLQRWIVGRTLCVNDDTPVISLAGADFRAPFYLCVVESDMKVEPTKSNITANIETHESQKNNDNVYTELMQLEQQALVPNAENFECGVCMEVYEPGQGVVLRECVHTFCKYCLSDVVRHCEEPDVPCPAIGCRGMLQEREIRSLVTLEDYERWLARGLAAAESGTRNAFHCRTRDCKGWALCEPGVQRFPCPVCGSINCVPCQAIHLGETCEEYRNKVKKSVSENTNLNETDDGTRTLLNSLISKGEALECPECSAIITKKWGCDWVKCSACKTEICWVTRGRRWGPGGKGDTSGGCRCGVDGKRCHPSCGYCH